MRDAPEFDRTHVTWSMSKTFKTKWLNVPSHTQLWTCLQPLMVEAISISVDTAAAILPLDKLEANGFERTMEELVRVRDRK